MEMGDRVKGGKKECQEENTAGSKASNVDWGSYQWSKVYRVIIKRFESFPELEPKKLSCD